MSTAQDQAQQVTQQDNGAPTQLSLTDQNQNPQGQDSQGGEPQAAALQGVQKRIDELTAKYHAAERIAQEAQARAQQSTELLAQMMSRPQEPQVRQEPQLQVPEGMDEATARYMQALFERTLDARVKPLMAQLQGVQGATAAQQAQQAAQAFGDKVAQRSAQLAAQWQAAGLHNVFKPDDAAIYALGEERMRELRAQAQAQGLSQQSRAAAQGFAGGMDMPGARGAPGVSGSGVDAPVPDWADHSSPNYDMRRGEAYWMQRAQASLKR